MDCPKWQERNPLLSGRAGVTVAELLSIIAVLAILVMVLSPVFARTDERGMERSCKSNLRQLSAALVKYLEDWEACFPDHASVTYPPNIIELSSGYVGQYPSDFYSNSMGANWLQWYAMRYRYKEANGDYSSAGIGRTFEPYIKDITAFKCPGEWTVRSGDASPGYLRYDVLSSYYIKLGMVHYAQSNKRPVRYSEVTQPSKATLMYEEVWHEGSDRPYLWDQHYWSTHPERPSSRTVNCLFMDGHIGTIDVLWRGMSGFDGNWYFYQGEGTSPGTFTRLDRGARDVP